LKFSAATTVYPETNTKPEKTENIRKKGEKAPAKPARG